MKIRTKIAAALVAVATMMGVGIVSAAPAQAYSGSIIYTANCPGNALRQQLVIVENTAYDDIREYSYVYGSRNPALYAWTQIWNTYTDDPVGSNKTYVPVQNYDTYSYKMVDAHWNGLDMSLNWTYHVDCFY